VLEVLGIQAIFSTDCSLRMKTTLIPKDVSAETNKSGAGYMIPYTA
jgi:hypothetical protein